MRELIIGFLDVCGEIYSRLDPYRVNLFILSVIMLALVIQL